MKIYVASSWRNERLDHVVGMLRRQGWDVYDFRSGGVNTHTSHDKDEELSGHEIRAALHDPQLKAQADRDYRELIKCDALVCVLPCGRSAHLELGYALAMEKHVSILWAPGPVDLMYEPIPIYDHLAGLIVALVIYEDERLNVPWYLRWMK